MRIITKFSLALWLALTPAAAQFTDSDSNTVSGTVTPAAAAAYYFAANGLDTNPCTQAAPCLNIAKMQSLSYPPGSTINFRGRDTFTGCWALNSTNVPTGGISSNPILFQSYGTGRATMVGNCPDNGSVISPMFLIQNVNGVTVQNLNFNGGGATAVIWVENNGTVPTRGYTIQNIDAGNVQAAGSNRFSAIIFFAGNAYIGGGCAGLDQVQVLNSTLHGFSGVTSPDDNGVNGSSCGQNVTNVKYSGNHVWNIGGHPNAIGGAAANGILANGVQFAELSHNLVHDIGANTNSCGGPAGVWTNESDSVVIKFNEVYNMQPIPARPPGACDWVAYDLDSGTTNAIVEYNYAHNNAGACVLSYNNPGPNTIRYNVCENNDQQQLSGGELAITPGLSYVYGNTLYEAPGTAPTNTEPSCYAFGYSGTFTAGTFFENNICVLNRVSTLNLNLYSRSPGSDQTNVVFKNNLYHGGSDRWYPNGVLYTSLAAAQAAGWEANSKADQNPLLANAGAGGTCGTPTLTTGPQPCPSAYQLTHGSPALGAGIMVPNNGARDYYGNTVPASEATNIGADAGAH